MSEHEPSTIAEVADNARMHVRSLGVLVTLVTDETQIVLVNSGWPMASDDAYATPIDYSICRHAAANRSTLVITDAHADPLVQNSLAVLEVGIGSYLGVPFYIGNSVASAICAICTEKRDWSSSDVAHMERAAARAAVALMPDVAVLPDTLPLIAPRLHA
ncbi:MAG: GAF domain-containing protein [Pseudomonadota bacterium]